MHTQRWNNTVSPQPPERERSFLPPAMCSHLSRIMRIVLRFFFHDPIQSFTNGVTINCPSGDFMVQGLFAGFLCDLVGHKEVNCWKGHGALKCCHECRHVINHRVRPPAGAQVSICCTDRTKFGKRSNESLFALVDELATIAGTDNFDKVATDVGWNHEPHGNVWHR